MCLLALVKNPKLTLVYSVYWSLISDAGISWRMGPTLEGCSCIFFSTKKQVFLSLLYFSFLPLNTTAILRFQICRCSGFVQETKIWSKLPNGCQKFRVISCFIKGHFYFRSYGFVRVLLCAVTCMATACLMTKFIISPSCFNSLDF